MTDATAEMPDPAEEVPAKKGKLPLIIGLVLALVGGAGGFLAVQQGLLPFGAADHGEGRAEDHGTDHGAEHGADHGPSAPAAHPAALPDIAYVPLDPITVSMTGGRQMMHLRFRAELEVEKAHAHEVELIRPRIIDVLNGYLRALETQDLQDTQALTRLRAQMLRRIQIVAGQGRVRDLLIMDFVLN